MSGSPLQTFNHATDMNPHEQNARVIEREAAKQTDPLLRQILGAMAGANHELATEKDDRQVALEDVCDEVSRKIAGQVTGWYDVKLRDGYTAEPDNIAAEIKDLLMVELKSYDWRPE